MRGHMQFGCDGLLFRFSAVQCKGEVDWLVFCMMVAEREIIRPNENSRAFNTVGYGICLRLPGF